MKKIAFAFATLAFVGLAGCKSQPQSTYRPAPNYGTQPAPSSTGAPQPYSPPQPARPAGAACGGGKCG